MAAHVDPESTPRRQQGSLATHRARIHMPAVIETSLAQSAYLRAIEFDG